MFKWTNGPTKFKLILNPGSILVYQNKMTTSLLIKSLLTDEVFIRILTFRLNITLTTNSDRISVWLWQSLQNFLTENTL
jgi:hypothetical protein